MKVRDKILNELYQVELSEINVELGVIQDVEKMSEAVDNLLIQFVKITDDLKQKGTMLNNAYTKALKEAKSIGVDAEPLMRESGKAIGKLKMYKLI